MLIFLLWQRTPKPDQVAIVHLLDETLRAQEARVA
jgi:hypothetical protein